MMRVAGWRGLSGTPLEYDAWHLGLLGVLTFFVISGFIMMHSFGRFFGEPGASIRFWKRRVQRIVPIYWIATAIAGGLLIVLPHGPPPGLSSWLHSLLFIPQATVPGQPMRPILGQGWTLNYEMFFYALFGLALLLPRKTGVIALVGTLVGLVLLGSLIKPLADTRDPYSIATFYTDPIIGVFGAGVLLALLWKRWGHLTVPGGFWLSLLPLAAAQFIFAGALKSFPLNLYWLPVVWASAVLAVALCIADRQSLKGRHLKWAVLLGDASYSTYLFHTLTITVLGKIGQRLPPEWDGAFVVAAVLASHLVGVLVYRFVETQISVWFRRIVPRASYA